jgi:hypothetical protein
MSSKLQHVIGDQFPSCAMTMPWQNIRLHLPTTGWWSTPITCNKKAMTERMSYCTLQHDVDQLQSLATRPRKNILQLATSWW